MGVKKKTLFNCGFLIGLIIRQKSQSETKRQKKKKEGYSKFGSKTFLSPKEESVFFTIVGPVGFNMMNKYEKCSYETFATEAIP